MRYTELKNAVKAADLKAQYDARVKRLVGHKRVLAQILIKTVDEFKGMNPKTVANCIEGTPYISTVPVERANRTKPAVQILLNIATQNIMSFLPFIIVHLK